ncbi:MAG: 30S ribosomal protein S1 [Clostridia bacterium]|nr:30S ribosomal protein S1 [Clostridia bacterium]
MTDNLYLPEGYLTGTEENEYCLSGVRGLRAAMETGRIVEAYAAECESGTMDLRVDLRGIRGVIPREEAVFSADGSPVKDIAVITRVAKPVCFKVIGLYDGGEGRPTAVLSRRAAQKECAERYVSKLRPGDVIPAAVTHLEPFGAFVDIGCGIVSLITVDSISVSRISHPGDRFSPGDRISAVVKSRDPETGRITLTHRELLGTWEENAAAFGASRTVSGIVRGVEEYGVFVELAPNLAGLAEPKEGVGEGDPCAVYIKSIIPEKMKIKLVLVDAGVGEVRLPVKYYVDPATTKRMTRWRYSPECCPRVIETVFE